MKSFVHMHICVRVCVCSGKRAATFTGIRKTLVEFTGENSGVVLACCTEFSKFPDRITPPRIPTTRSCPFNYANYESIIQQLERRCLS